MVRVPKYPSHGRVRDELNRRVDAYFADNGLSKSGGWRFLLKALIILSWFCLSYVAMVFWAGPWWVVGLCAVSLGLAQAGIGFSIMHDGGHGAAFERRWASKLAAYSLDFIGASSQLWVFKHNVLHHQYPNVEGVDHDIVVEPWLRLSNSQKHHRFHRAQYLYFPFAYALLSMKWLLHDDFRTLIKGRVGSIKTPPISRRKIGVLLAWKLFAFGWGFALPIALHGVVWTLVVFGVWASVCGFTLAAVFQLAHSVQSTEITRLPPEGKRLPRTWAHQQLASTMDFAPNNPFVTWYVGGLNFQIEHHLFPRISHVHYPAIAPIVREVCAEHDMPYHSKDSMFSAMMDHARHLRALGRRPT